ncbi:MAG: 30S ribosomal protein S17 [candidate division KSB1 bacterium]|nr:30S ribosomal protein S17 [candidate division KSB1 bacterium]
MERGKRKSLIGIVSSNKMDKTCVVKVQRFVEHPLYKKYVKKSKKFMAHDMNNDSRIGDKVKIMEARPISRKKRWRLVEIIERAK